MESNAERLKRTLTGAKLPDQVFIKPFDIATRNGNIYVTDTMASVVHVFNLPRRRYFYFGFRFEGTLRKPTGIALDDTGNVHVVDTQNHQVITYDHLGLFQQKFGNSDLLSRPVNLAVDSQSERIYVVDNGGVDSANHRIAVFDLSGQFLFHIGTRGHAPDTFNQPADVVVASDGTIYVLDAGNFRIKHFNQQGTLLDSWGEIGRHFGSFARPRHLAIDAQDRLYVTDAFFGNIQIFQADGKLLLPIGEPSAENLPGRYGLIAGISVDETGRIYTIDQLHNKIDVYRPLNQ